MTLFIYDAQITNRALSSQPTFLSGTKYNTANSESPLGVEIRNGKYKIFYFETTHAQLNTTDPIKGWLRFGLTLKLPCEVKSQQELIYLLNKLNQTNWFKQLLRWLFFKLKKK